MSDAGPGGLERENAKLRKINRVLMDRVERNTDFQGNAFSLFQTAIVLESKVRERTTALEEALRELEVAKGKADQGNLSKTRFLAAASHDLLQPLSAARIFASTLAERRLAPGNRDLACRVLAALDSVEEILTALLDISKLDAGAEPVSIADFHLATVFGVLAEEFGILALRKGVSLRFIACSLAVRSDRRLLARVLRNYVSNAIRYTAPGGRVLVGCRRRRGALLIGVWDTGRGVPADKLEEIFEEFRRLDVDGKESERGVGLGLAIVRRIARGLEHPLEVRSRPGRGSLFGIVVPLAAAAPPPPSARPQIPEPVAVSGLRGARIVVVDNDEAVLAGLLALLGNWGCETIGAVSGAAAQTAIAARPWRPDLIVADYYLSRQEVGLDVVAAIRRQFDARVPAVVITADYSAQLEARVRQAGCYLLNKPVHKGKLRSLLAHLLRDRAGN
jgi:signal transduction histidine kinase/CheY-like chemotaxis protein